MLRVQYSSQQNEWVPGALAHISGGAADDAYCLLFPYCVLRQTGTNFSALRRLTLLTPDNHIGGSYLVNAWVRRVWSDALRGLAVVKVTPPARQWLHARGTTCFEMGTSIGERVTRVTYKDFGLVEEEVTTVSVEEESLSTNEVCSRDGFIISRSYDTLLAVTVASDSGCENYRIDKLSGSFVEERSRQMRLLSKLLTLLIMSYKVVPIYNTV